MGCRITGIENFSFFGDHDNGRMEFVRIADGKADDQVTSPFKVLTCRCRGLSGMTMD